MTQLDNKEAVIDMVTSLSKYYRYTTRAEQQLTKLSSEMDLVVHYLNIQSLQTNRIRYSVDIPEAMMSQPVPKLIVQPIVENAIKHGIEPKKGPGTIVVKGWQEGRMNRLVVEDTGEGMEPDALQSLNRKLLEPMDEHMGCGVWNVHQRLAHRFGPGSGLLLSRAESGGLRAELRWISEEENR
ncbi:sensor histidine kinase [Cohnella zeiphila]|uniref:Histidine kinase n=1 Tax=Cohnella zeiphila TaxID=2761120 RepID=A0A7X0SU08_9BACL|nr:ATP-binding protein [Cohnella zeiphila]MBB6736078.1 histidine kinase [Cohnella zeiphila]